MFILPAPCLCTKILVVLFFFSGKFTVCVHGIDNCVEMFQIITIYDDERAINVVGFNSLAQAYAKTLMDKVFLKHKLHVLHLELSFLHLGYSSVLHSCLYNATFIGNSNSSMITVQ